MKVGEVLGKTVLTAMFMMMAFSFVTSLVFPKDTFSPQLALQHPATIVFAQEEPPQEYKILIEKNTLYIHVADYLQEPIRIEKIEPDSLNPVNLATDIFSPPKHFV